MTAFIACRPLRLSVAAVVALDGDSTYVEGPPAATTFTLTGATAGTNGVPTTFTVAPDGVMATTVVVTPAASNGGAVNPTTLTFASGSSASQTFTVTRFSDGVSVVSMSNNGGLSESGDPINYSTTPAEGWDTVIPTQNGQVGVPFSVDLDTFFNGTLPTYSVQSGSLPAGLSLSGTRNRILSGTPTTAQTVSPFMLAVTTDSLETDWQSRANFAIAQGGRAIRFNTSAEAIGTPSSGNTNAYINSGVQSEFNSHIQWEQTIKRSGAGSLRFNILNGDGTDSGAWRWHIRPDLANIPNGGEYYIQWTQYMPVEFCHAVFPGDGTGDFGSNANGFKHLILSHYGVRIGPNSWGAESGSEAGGSNNGEAVVVENSGQSGYPRVYYYSPNITRDATETGINIPQCVGFMLRLQNAIDNGSPTVTNCATAQQRYGPLYPTTPFSSGAPSASNGGVVYVPGWMTFMVRIKIGSYGSPNSTIEVWGCVTGQAPRKFTSTTVAQIGFGLAGHGGVHFLPYNTHKVGGIGYDTFTCFTEILTSIGASPIPFPGGFTVTPV